MVHNTALASHLVPLAAHLMGLTAIHPPSEEHQDGLQQADASKNPCKYFYPPLYAYVLSLCGCAGLACFGGWLAGGSRSRRGRMIARLGWFLGFIGAFGVSCTFSTFAFGDPLFFWSLRWLRGQSHSDKCYGDYHGISVTQKCLTHQYFCNTVIDMANVLPQDKQIAVIGALAEGSSIRSIERLTGVHRDTIMRLGVRAGRGCELLLDSKMQDLGCRYLQMDEVWGFIGKKERHVRVDDDPTYGDVWTYCAIDSETKLVPSFKCGKRNLATTTAFVQDVASRMRNRVQISTDALHGYTEAVERSFGADVDYGQIVKIYTHDSAQHPERKYSAPSFASAMRRPIAGEPEMELVSTSHIERLNATTRLHVKRLSRLTLAFSKKLENFQAAVALHFAYYNFVRRHNTLRCTPAMAAGVERDFWTVGKLVEAVV
jgi:IS1 family transposase